MSEARFRLVFHGNYAEGFNPIEVVTNLQTLLSLPRVRVLGMIARPPAIIRAGLSRQAAEQERVALAEAGFVTLIEPDVDMPQPWDGVERRMGERRASSDRRGERDDGRGDRRRRGRRSTD